MSFFFLSFHLIKFAFRSNHSSEPSAKVRQVRELNGLRRRQQSSSNGRLRVATVVLQLVHSHLPRDFLLRRLRVLVALFVEAFVTARFLHALKIVVVPRLVRRQRNIILVAKERCIEVEAIFLATG